MKLITVQGLMGSGKTTLIKRLIRGFHERQKQSAVILNEEGDEIFDPDFVKDHNLRVDVLRGG